MKSVSTLLTLAAFHALSYGQSIEKTLPEKEVHAMAAAIAAGGSQAHRLLARTVQCEPDSLAFSLAVYKRTVNASAIPALTLALNNSIANCPEKILSELTGPQVNEVCGAYSIFEEPELADKRISEKHYARLRLALQSKRVTNFAEKVSLCISAQKPIE